MKLATHNGSQLFYEIRVEGELGDMWSGWFAGLSLGKDLDEQTGRPVTLLYGFLPDQPALHAVLNKIRDLNLTLVSINRHEPI